MARHQITIDDEMLHALFQDDEGLARLVEAVLNQILKGQVSDQLQALPYERSEERQGQRNGYRPREMKTRVGPLNLEIPGYAVAVSPRRCSPDTSAASRPWYWR